jgi:hypothetical protein
MTDHGIVVRDGMAPLRNIVNRHDKHEHGKYQYKPEKHDHTTLPESGRFRMRKL